MTEFIALVIGFILAAVTVNNGKLDRCQQAHQVECEVVAVPVEQGGGK